MKEFNENDASRMVSYRRRRVVTAREMAAKEFTAS